jgi:hypothetical protein
MVVGLVSGTGAGLGTTLVCSTATACSALLACFDSNGSAVCRPRFEFSRALSTVVFADEACGGGRPDLRASGRSAEPFSTGSDTGLMLKKSVKSFNPSEIRN